MYLLDMYELSDEIFIENTPVGYMLRHGDHDQLHSSVDTYILYYHHSLHPVIATYERDDDKRYVLLGVEEPKYNDPSDKHPNKDSYYCVPFPYKYELIRKSVKQRVFASLNAERNTTLFSLRGNVSMLCKSNILHLTVVHSADMLKEKEAYFQLNSNNSNIMKDGKYLNDKLMLLLQNSRRYSHRIVKNFRTNSYACECWSFLI